MLISGKDALIALANGEDVEYRVEDFANDWNCADSLKASEILNGMVEIFDSATDQQPKYYEAYFRLKPKTILLNGVEIPAPFEPKSGDYVYFISSDEVAGYAETTLVDTPMNWGFVQFGAWRTKEEIKQVVAALRKVFKEPQQ